jgi:hypothetical protein
VTNDGSTTGYVSKEGITSYGPDSVTIYTANSNGNVAPMATISGPLTQLDKPSGIVVDSIGNVYVANDASGGGHPSRLRHGLSAGKQRQRRAGDATG